MSTWNTQLHPEEMEELEQLDPCESELCQFSCETCKFISALNEPDQFLTDSEADGDALASAGFGTDEDYGHFGDFE